MNSNWRAPSLSELTPMIYNIELTHLGSEVSNCDIFPRQKFLNTIKEVILDLKPTSLKKSSQNKLVR